MGAPGYHLDPETEKIWEIVEDLIRRVDWMEADADFIIENFPPCVQIDRFRRGLTYYRQLKDLIQRYRNPDSLD